MRKAIPRLLLTVILGLMVVGCSHDHNPLGSLNSAGLKPTDPKSPSILGNRVWNDVNNDGIQGDTLLEPGIPGVNVSLFTCADIKLSSMVTNSKGLYFFPLLPAGNYYIKFALPQGYKFSPKNVGSDSLDSDADTLTGKTECISLDSSTADLTWDAGMYLTQVDTVVGGTVGGRVWYDANKDGIMNDTLQNDVIDSVAVELFTCTDSLIATMHTDTAGEYEFVDVVPGQYYLMFTLPMGYEFSPMAMTNDSLASDPNPATGKTNCFPVDSAQVELSWNAGIFQQPVDTVVGGTVGGRVWFDVNKDGIQNDTVVNDAVDSLPVKLFTCAGAWVAMARTGLAGEYEFADLVPGEYYLKFTLPMGYKFSPMNMADDSLDSDPNPCTGKTVCFQVDSAEVEMTWDAGIWQVPPLPVCTRSKGYWKNLAGFGPQKDMVTPLLPIWLGTPDSSASIDVTNARIAFDILQMKTYGDPFNGITKLYAQLLAAKLNIAAGTDGSAVASAIMEADGFLGANGWQNWGQLSKTDRKQVLKWMSMFAQYNGGEIGPGSCGDFAENDHDHGDSDNSDNDNHDGGHDGGSGHE